MSQIKHSIPIPAYFSSVFSIVWKPVISQDPDGAMPEEITWQSCKPASPPEKVAS